MEARSAVATIAASVCRPLKTRVEQMIISGGEPSRERVLLLQRMSALLLFYQTTIQQLTGDAGALNSTLQELATLCANMFSQQLQKLVSQSCAVLAIPPEGSVSSSPELSSLLSLVSSIVTADMLSQQHNTMHEVVDAVIRPVMHTLASLTASPGTSVYLLNSYHAIHATTSMLGLEHALTAIQDATNAELSLLSATQNMAMLHSVGLVGQGGKGLGSDVESHRLRQVLAAVDQFLGNPDAYMLPCLSGLESANARTAVVHSASTALLTHYTTLHDMFSHTGDERRAMFSKSPDTVRQLLPL